MNVDLRHGDCLEVLRTLPDCSVDAVVTDPPYGLSFMGKRWDYDVPGVKVWAECLRVLKPGGHLLAFAGTRTQHRMAVRIEDAGFEIRDLIAWVYGSGFPKSLDVSKAIDRMDASEEQERRRLRFTAWVRSTGVTSRQIDEATGTNMGGHYTTAASQPAIMTREHLEACRHLLGDVPEWVEREADIRSVESRNMAKREVVGQHTKNSPGNSMRMGMLGAKADAIQPITAPATDAARQWSGWGTALKPALEPITVARKPLDGTVAENVLRHGTGAVNVDGCRVGTEAVTINTWNDGAKPFGGGAGHEYTGRTVQGRWPANLILSYPEDQIGPDGKPLPNPAKDEVVGLFPQSSITGKRSNRSRAATVVGTSWGVDNHESQEYTDTGSAARFFYCAKASKADRNSGGVNSNHPTVKPTDLMRYLCRLVTPPGGVVLDPFMGSGSTGKGAVLEGFRFIGIEREAEYLTIARARIASAEADAAEPRQATLFQEAEA